MLIRILKTSKVTLTHTFTVDETLTDAAGSVTVAVKRLDGTDAGSGTATHTTTGTYTYALTPSASVDTWTVDWSGSIAGATVVARDIVEIVGDFYFGLAEVRTEMKIPAIVSSAALAQRRTEVEQEAERICQVAFVPRFERQKLNGSGSPLLGTKRRFLRAVRAVSIAGVAMDAPTLATLGFTDDGVITRPGGACWPAGAGNIIVEYEYGYDIPPEEIRTASKLRLRAIQNRTTSGVPDRALSFTAPDGGVYRLTTPSRQKTGMVEVDGVYERYFRPPRAVFA